MPPPLALALTLSLILFLLVRDSRRQASSGFLRLWIPCLWLLFIGSRPFSAWLNLGVMPSGNAELLHEGSPIDAAALAFLMVSGLVILWRRGIRWGEVVRNNVWLILYFAYCGISVLWSDFPQIASKRWLKALGDPIMALVVLTERDPARAIETVIQRCYIILIPLSICFIKYFPDLGRGFDPWTGAAVNMGATVSKNGLGYLTVVFGLYSVYRLCIDWPRRKDPQKRRDILWLLLLFYLNLWCLLTADSKTSLLILLLGTLVIFMTGYQTIRINFGKFLALTVLVYGILELSIGISSFIITSSGRDSTMSGRTELWAVVLGMHDKFLFGYGFESFWLGDRLRKLWELFFFAPNQAHNGYIDLYLNLGAIGLFLVGGLIISCFRHIQKMLVVPLSPETSERMAFDRFRLAFLLSVLFYNVSEAGFKSLHFLFVILLVLFVRYRHQIPLLATQSSFAQVGRPASSLGNTVREGKSW